MLVADVLSITFAVLGFLLSLQGIWLLCRAAWPHRVNAAREVCRERPRGSLALGAVLFVAAGLASVALLKGEGAAKILGGTLACAFLLYAHVGVAGLVTHLGEGLPSPGDTPGGWRTQVRGGLALELSFLFPVLGWFGLLLGSTALGAGAVTLSLVGGRPSALPATGADR